MRRERNLNEEKKSPTVQIANSECVPSVTLHKSQKKRFQLIQSKSKFLGFKMQTFHWERFQKKYRRSAVFSRQSRHFGYPDASFFTFIHHFPCVLAVRKCDELVGQTACASLANSSVDAVRTRFRHVKSFGARVVFRRVFDVEVFLAGQQASHAKKLLFLLTCGWEHLKHCTVVQFLRNILLCALAFWIVFVHQWQLQQWKLLHLLNLLFPSESPLMWGGCFRRLYPPLQIVIANFFKKKKREVPFSRPPWFFKGVLQISNVTIHFSDWAFLWNWKSRELIQDWKSSNSRSHEDRNK